MSIAAATIRMRPARGPALGKAPLPFAATVVSAFLHVALALAFVLAARAWTQSQPKIYVVNLVPAVAAVGTPQAQTPPALPPRADEVPRAEPTRRRRRVAPRRPARAAGRAGCVDRTGGNL